MRQLALASFGLWWLVACGGGPAGGSDGAVDASSPDGGGAACASDGMRCGDGRICLGGVCTASTCGDGIVDDRIEDCEDGNQIAFDGCEPGTCQYTCRSDTGCDDLEPCNGAETCTDHRCAAGTALADGATCTTTVVADGACRAGTEGQQCVPRGCGNGVVDGEEDCDDMRDGDDADGCTDLCTFTCTTDADCDDATVCTGTETCDTTAHTCSSTGALDCNDSSPCTTDSCDPVTGCGNVLIDADGDGHAALALGACGDDCDDSRPTVYMGAEELCDGLDNDCDTNVDEIRPTWYVDCDGDGYAASLVGAMPSCDPPPTSATGCGTPTATWTATRPTGTSNTDCADDNPARRPGAMELATCNGIDEDCDGAADNGVTATLTVNRMGTGAGSVASSPTGLACPSTCTRAFLCGTSVSLTPTANLGSTFGGWSGDCTGSGACSVSMSANRVVNATFNATYNLVVNTNGMGSVSLNPSGTSCGAGCTTYASGTPVVLTAMPASGWSFVRWSGACSGTTPTCNLTMTGNRNVTAELVQMRTLSVSRTGTGTGTVTSGEGMISCGGTCSAMYPEGTGVNLQATPDPGSMFNGWGGACASFSGMSCNVVMAGNQSVTASFVPACGAAGSACGSGIPCCSGLSCVSGSCQGCRPDGNSCGTSSECCSGSCFGGVCGGSGTVRLTIQFTNQNGNRVRVDPIGAICDDFASPCTYSFSPGQFINLTAEGACFRQWLGGPCAGSSSNVCSFNITSDMTVTTDWFFC